MSSVDYVVDRVYSFGRFFLFNYETAGTGICEGTQRRRRRGKGGGGGERVKEGEEEKREKFL